MLRAYRIIYYILYYRLDRQIHSKRLKTLFFLFKLTCPWLFFLYSKEPAFAIRLRDCLNDLGPIFIKCGQLLSTRRDILSPDLAAALATLQDNVPPFSSEKAEAMIVSALGAPIHELFKTFDRSPLAAASIAQVHAATLHTGEAIVVKVLRPQVEQQVKRDLRLLRKLATFFSIVWPPFRGLKPKVMLDEITHILEDELDLRKEAANASLLRRQFEHSPLIYVPEMRWEFCTKTVLAMERIYGIPISEVEELKARGFDLKKLATRGVELFFTQALFNCFFHADMHAGNIFVNPNKPDNPQYIVVDFGIMGTLSPRDQHYLLENFVAFFRRDYRRVAILHIEAGWIPKHVRLDRLEARIRTLCEPIFGRPLKDLSLAKMLLPLLELAREFEIDLQPQLLLLQKTLMNIDGLGRQLYPELDLWATALPLLEHWLRQRWHPKVLWKQVKERLIHAWIAGPFEFDDQPK